MKKLVGLVVLSSTLLISNGVYAGNAANEFSATTNPTGAWSYGWENALGGSFFLFTKRLSFSGVDSWYGNQPPIGLFPGYPIIWRSSVPTTDILTAHPGQGGEYAVLRWTAPAAGVASIAASFVQNASNPATADVHVLFNGSSLYSGVVNGSVASLPYSNSSQFVSSGSVLDFAVGYGGNRNIDFDTIDMNINVIFTPVPEPLTSTLLAIGVLLLFSSRRFVTRAGK